MEITEDGLAILQFGGGCNGFMAFAYFAVHGASGNILMPLLNNGELAALYSLVFLYFVFSGAGAFALDNRFGDKMTK